jgi:rfaE bifunctional protein kinase chain/domain
MEIALKKILNVDKIRRNFKKINSKKILVVGDIILDNFIFGEVERISPEAPVPVVEVKDEKFMLGGAGNVCLNIKNMGGDVFIISSIGKDENGNLLKRLLERENIKFFFIERKLPTIIKTRVIAKTQQIIRIDREKIEYLNREEERRTKIFISKIIDDFDCIVVSDYGKGFITEKIMNFLKSFKKKIIVDPKPNHFNFYKNVFCLTPNQSEAIAGVRKLSVKNFKEIVKVGIEIIKKLKCENLIITLGKNGMLIYENKNIYHIPSVAKEVYDVTGAGDTVCGIFSLYFSISGDLLESAIISNFAAGIVVGKLGTATTDQKEFIDFFEKNYRNILIEKIQ